MIDLAKHIINQTEPVKQALKQLNQLGNNLTLFVVDDTKKLVGTLTDGDVRRGIVEGLELTASVKKFMFHNFRYLQRNNYSISDLDEFRNKGIKLIPIVDEDFKILRLINLSLVRSIIPADALILAGGVGERLKPLTEKTPKPLLNVGGKPIIEHNIDRLIHYGIDNINISIRYLGEQLVNYFGDGKSKGIQINYTTETVPLGTIGALKLVNEIYHDSILVMNSDLLTTIDFEDFFKQFEQDNADMTVAAIPYPVNIPYAVLETRGNEIVSLQEKPTYTYYSNAGIYLLKKEVLKFIPENKFFNATDLIELLISQGRKVTNYPILGYWLDIGRMEDYKRAQEDIKHLKL